MASKGLWSAQDTHLWNRALRSYGEATAKTPKAALRQLERWYVEELPPAIASRHPHHMTKEELVRLVEWKLSRGTWRPKLLDYAKQQQAGAVEEATGAAFKLIEGCCPGDMATVRSALDLLTQLKGVGPATASAMLATACPHTPYMSDEALGVCMRNREYTSKAYMALAEVLQGRAKQLGAAATLGLGDGADAAAASGSPLGAWTAVAVERALWAVSVLGLPAAAMPEEEPAQAAGLQSDQLDQTNPAEGEPGATSSGGRGQQNAADVGRRRSSRQAEIDGRGASGSEAEANQLAKRRKGKS